MKVKEYYTKDHTLEDANSMPDPEYDKEWEEAFKESMEWYERQNADKAWIEKTERELF